MAFLGSFRLPQDNVKLKLGLSQSKLFRNYRSMLHMNLAMLDTESLEPLYRGWVDVQDLGSVLQTIELNSTASEVDVIAYPNVVNWENIYEHQIYMEFEQEYPDDAKKQGDNDHEYLLERGQKTVLSFGPFEALQGEYGYLELETQDVDSKISIPITF
ncbi:MAG: hypothetical protein AB8G05_22230 [Oligoflexales bacterium]